MPLKRNAATRRVVPHVGIVRPHDEAGVLSIIRHTIPLGLCVFLPVALSTDHGGGKRRRDIGMSLRTSNSGSLNRYPKQANNQSPKPEPNQCAKAENRREDNEHTNLGKASLLAVAVLGQIPDQISGKHQSN